MQIFQISEFSKFKKHIRIMCCTYLCVIVSKLYEWYAYCLSMASCKPIQMLFFAIWLVHMSSIHVLYHFQSMAHSFTSTFCTLSRFLVTWSHPKEAIDIQAIHAQVIPATLIDQSLLIRSHCVWQLANLMLTV